MFRIIVNYKIFKKKLASFYHNITPAKQVLWGLMESYGLYWQEIEGGHEEMMFVHDNV